MIYFLWLMISMRTLSLTMNIKVSGQIKLVCELDPNLHSKSNPFHLCLLLQFHFSLFYSLHLSLVKFGICNQVYAYCASYPLMLIFSLFFFFYNIYIYKRFEPTTNWLIANCSITELLRNNDPLGLGEFNSHSQPMNNMSLRFPS